MIKSIKSRTLSFIIIVLISTTVTAQKKYEFRSSGTISGEEYMLFTGKSKERTFTVKWNKDIWLSEKFHKVDSISKDGFLEVNDDYRNQTHWLRIEPSENKLSYTYSKNGNISEIDHETNQWLVSAMEEVIYPYLKAIFHNRFYRNSEELITVKVGSKFPLFEKLDIDKNKISSEDIKDKLTVINFWNIYCGPCIKEMPELNELTIKYNDPLKYKFIAFSSSNKKQIQKLFKKRKDLEFNFTHIPDSGDIEELLGFQFNPVHFIVDSDGIIVYIKVGYSSDNITMMGQVIERESKNL